MSFSTLYYFGDSLTDGGGFFEVSSAFIANLEAVVGAPIDGLAPIPPSPPYAEQFSNGPVYSEVAPALLGVSDDAVFNFAIGGAQALGETLFGPLVLGGLPDLPFDPSAVLDPAILNFDIDLGGQVGRFLETVAVAPPPPGSAASLLIGLNDFGAFAPTSPETTVEEAFALVAAIVNANIEAAATFAAAGVETIIINTLPTSSFFNSSALAPPEETALGDLAVDATNAGLELGAAQLAAAGIDVRIVDLNALTDEITADQSTFGFQVIDTPVLLGSGVSVVPNPALDFETLPFGVEQVAFFDFVHFTASLHGVIGAFTEASLTSDVTILGDADDFAAGGSGDDLILTAGGNDVITSNGGNDVVLAGLGDDVVITGSGSNLVSGGSGDDRLIGGSNSDVLAGGAGDDTLFAGRGADGLIDGLGSDRLFGGTGDDVFLFTQAELVGGDGMDSDVFYGGAGNDQLVLALDADTLAIEEAAFAEAGFMPGDTYSFVSFDLTIRGIEDVVFTEGFGFGLADPAGGDVSVTGDLGDRLAEADLFGFV